MIYHLTQKLSYNIGINIDSILKSDLHQTASSILEPFILCWFRTRVIILSSIASKTWPATQSFM